MRSGTADVDQWHRVIRPRRGLVPVDFRELWRYRDLLWFQVVRDIAGRYRQMALGPIWMLLQPLVNMVIFSMIFGQLARFPSEGLPYPLFTYAAILPWTFFASAADNAMGSLVTEMRVISKVYFPRMILPFAAVMAAFVDFVMSLAILAGLMFYYRRTPPLQVALLPLPILLAAATALAIGLWGASLTVRFRDARVAIGYATRAAMYLTPVAYAASLVSKRAPQWMWLYKLNPLYWVTEGFRWCLLGVGNPPEPYMLIPVGCVAAMLISAAYAFGRAERTVVDLL